MVKQLYITGADSGWGWGWGGPGGQDHPTPPFGGPPDFIKRVKTSTVCVRKRRNLVVNSYPDPPPPLSQNPVSAPALSNSGCSMEFYDASKMVRHSFSINTKTNRNRSCFCTSRRRSRPIWYRINMFLILLNRLCVLTL